MINSEKENKTSEHPEIFLKGENIQTFPVPKLENNFYLKQLSVLNSNIFAVIQRRQIVIHNRSQSTSNPFQSFKSRFSFSCVKFNKSSKVIAAANHQGEVQLADFHSSKVFYKKNMHQKRVGVLEFNPLFESVGVTGSKDNSLAVWDYRDQRSALSINGHRGEVCGLDWYKNGYEFSSGDNNNTVHIWDLRNLKTPTMSISSFGAAVRALKYSPFKSHLLATGGGSGDMTLRVFDVKKR